MRQLLFQYKSGRGEVVETPPPLGKAGCLLVRTAASLVSVGTEKYVLELAKKSVVGRALARPDLVHRVMGKAQVDGILRARR